MHDNRTLVENRIRRELFERVMPAMYSSRIPMAVTAWDVPGEPVPVEVARAALLAGEFRPFTIGAQWSRPWGTTWFQLDADVPSEWVGPQLEAVIDLGFHQDAAGFQSEGLVYTDRGALQGVHPRRTGVPLPDQVAGPLSLLVEAASNPAFPGFRPSQLGSLDTAGAAPLYRLREASLGVRDETVFALLLDIEVLFGLMTSLPLNEQRRQRLLRQLESAFDALDLQRVGATAASARALLAPALAQPARASAHRVIGVGHAHIDSAWLWPLRETERKCARTFASATTLMDAYPDYRFVCSQAAQYDWVERQHPEVFERITAKVASGQWQPVGGMWVEADMNLPSGESIVRQMVFGQRYFEERFGVRCKEVWIPDVFGYPGSLPQIFAAGGMHRFITQKLSWNKQNVFPHSTFWWEGIDGSRVLTHFPPVDTYNASVTADQMVFTDHNFKEHGWSDWSLMPFGHGNGGGGPTREMVERARRMADLDGTPRVSIGTTDEFFDRVEEEIAGGAPVPVWRGELYFEMHRGTLTSQAQTKLGNRRCERLLREAELWWAARGSVPDDVVAALDDIWRSVLLQQFHDIIPGSSIAWVHDDAEAAHAGAAAALEDLVQEALSHLCAPAGAVANAGAHARREVVVASLTPPGAGQLQALVDGGHAFVAAAPGSGLGPFEALATDDRVVVTEQSMANGSIAVHWDLDGNITSIVDVRHARELLPAGSVIGLQIAPDHPVEYDAWDLEDWSEPLATPLAGDVEIELVDRGPLVATLRVRRAFGSSAVVSSYRLRAESARMDIELDIDWQEAEQWLSLHVPIDVRADEAACDIQFGHVRRPMHASSSWDAAKFEVCAHRWVDVAEPGFGVAVLNDGRYGHRLFSSSGRAPGVRVSLLKAARYPDPEADRGRHRVTIAVLPHGPGLHDVLHEAEALNVPLRVVHDGDGEDAPPVVHIDQPGVWLSAVKRADDGSGDLVVRLHEACGDRTRTIVRLPQRITEASRCDVYESPTESLDTADGIIALTLNPFELVTLRLRT